MNLPYESRINEDIFQNYLEILIQQIVGMKNYEDLNLWIEIDEWPYEIDEYSGANVDINIYYDRLDKSDAKPKHKIVKIRELEKDEDSILPW